MSEEFSIMWYARDGLLDSKGLMTKEEAEVYAKTLEPEDRIIGWREGTCQSVFQFWATGDGQAIEIPHNEEPPTGRRAAILVQKAKSV